MSITRFQEPEDVARLLPGQPGADAHVTHDDFPLVVAKVLGVGHVVALGALAVPELPLSLVLVRRGEPAPPDDRLPAGARNAVGGLHVPRAPCAAFGRDV